ncbi:MAG: Stp1/IreP family PP2C-type Ser/Thr phosphatase [Syntrophomonadaceae bacterium]|nr:Stp1/IreP family PP2C-type Ser/Thr phosphatase [Syntrophomonadaceae bacterium]
MKAAGVTDIGLYRKRNEDHYYIDTDKGIFLVCDGMGGHKGGDVASQMAVETVRQSLDWEGPDDLVPSLLKTIQLANEVIYNKGQTDESLHEMGTTLTTAVILDQNMTIAHVGDSSLFHYRAGVLKKITRDHTLAEQMRADGLLKQEDIGSNVYNHVLTRAVGVEDHVETDIYHQEIAEGDWILLSTDGLTDLVKENEICEYLDSAHDPQATAGALVELALSKGGYDNITIVLLSI